MSGRKPTSHNVEQAIVAAPKDSLSGRCRFCGWVSPKRNRRAKIVALVESHIARAHPERSLPAEDPAGD
jgi:hypothetical protein